MFNPTSPVTGAAVTGLTSPTYTLTAIAAANAWSKAYAVTALGGTQTGVSVSSTSNPFTVTAYQPQNIRILNAVDANNVLRNVPYNTWGVRTNKGMLPLAGQAYKNGTAETRFSIPAGSDLADAPSINALVSAHAGVVYQQADGMAITIKTGSV